MVDFMYNHNPILEFIISETTKKYLIRKDKVARS